MCIYISNLVNAEIFVVWLSSTSEYLFWHQRVQSQSCMCAYIAFFVRRLAYNHYPITPTYNAANTHTQGSEWAQWSKKKKKHSLEEHRTIAILMVTMLSQQKTILWTVYETVPCSQQLCEHYILRSCPHAHASLWHQRHTLNDAQWHATVSSTLMHRQLLSLTQQGEQE